VLALVPALVLAACGGGGGGEVTATTDGSPSTVATTTTAPATTTTLSEEEQALGELEGFTSQEDAEFRLFSNPPEIPGPLGRLGGAVEPLPEVLPILRANGDGTPVVNEAGENVFVGARFDAAGRLLAADDGQLLDDHAGPIPRDGNGPILLAVKFGPDGFPLATEDGKAQYERRNVPNANRVLAVGDSVLLGTQAELPASLLGWQTILDARESRLPGDGAAVIRGHADIGRVVIVMLGHNVGPGEDHRSRLNAIQAALDERPVVDRVVWVTAAEIGQGQLEWNEALRAFVAERREAGDLKAHLLDCSLYNAANPEYAEDDGLHLRGPGRQELASLLAQFVGPAPDCNVVIGAGPRAGECV